MGKITKPDYTDIWSSAGSKTAPSSLKIQTGWVGEKPPYEYWNYMMNRSDNSAAYSFQMGVSEWDSTIEYQYASGYCSYVQRNGLVYKTLQTGTNKDPLLQPTYWKLAFDNYGVAATVQTNLNTHITNYGTLASLSNVGTARTNLDVYSKSEQDARYAKLAGLSTQVFNVANGTTTYQAVNYSQLITKAALAGSSSQEFAVAAATTGNNAVNKTQFDAKTGQATETTAGIAEICTDAELLAGTSDIAVATPLKLRLGFGVSIGARGYVAFPTWLGGVVIQWGKETTVSSSTVINLPLATMTNCYSVVGTADQSLGADVEYVGFSAVSATNFTANTCLFPTAGGAVNPQGCSVWWIAIGK